MARVASSCAVYVLCAVKAVEPVALAFHFEFYTDKIFSAFLRAGWWRSTAGAQLLPSMLHPCGSVRAVPFLTSFLVNRPERQQVVAQGLGSLSVWEIQSPLGCEPVEGLSLCPFCCSDK